MSEQAKPQNVVEVHYRFTLKLQLDGLVLSTRWGTLKLTPKAANLLIVQEQP